MADQTNGQNCCTCFNLSLRKSQKPATGTDGPSSDEFFYRKFSDSLGISNLDLSPVPQRSKKNSASENSGSIAESKGSGVKLNNGKFRNNGKHKNGSKLSSTPESEANEKLLDNDEANVEEASPQQARSVCSKPHDPRRDGIVFRDSLSCPGDPSDSSSARDSFVTPQGSADFVAGIEPIWWTSFSDIPYVDESSANFSEGATSLCSSDTSRLLRHMAETGLLDSDSAQGGDRQRSFDSVFMELMYTRQKSEGLVEELETDSLEDIPRKRVYSENDKAEPSLSSMSCAEDDALCNGAIEEEGVDSASEEPLLSASSEDDVSEDSLTTSESDAEPEKPVEVVKKRPQRIRIPRSLSTNYDDGHLMPPLYHTTYTSDPLLMAYKSTVHDKL